MGIKIAFSGKGGAGKTTVAAFFIKALSKDGRDILAVDCDPVTNLGQMLGLRDADEITPIVEMKELIDQRTEASLDRAFYKLNPKVDDIPDKFAKRIDGIRLIVMGTVRQGGSGCMCPESSFVKALLSNILLQKNESVVMDMEAGVEHLGRATAGFVDHLFVVTEPTVTSVDVAKKIARLAKDIRIKEVSIVINKTRKPEDLEFVKNGISPLRVIGAVPFDERLLEFSKDKYGDLEKTDAYKAVFKIKDKIQKGD